MLPGLIPEALRQLGQHLGEPDGDGPHTPDGARLDDLADALDRLVRTDDPAGGAVRSSRGVAADEMHRRGLDALRAGDHETARRELARSLGLDGDRTAASLHLAVAELGCGDPAAAFGHLRTAVERSRPRTAALAATAALVAARLALAAGCRAAAVTVLTDFDRRADCQAVVEELVRLAPGREVRLVELVVGHAGEIEPFGRELLGLRGREYEIALRAAIDRALGERSDLLVAASQLRSRFRELAAAQGSDHREAARLEGLADQLLDAFTHLHDAPRPTRTSTPDLGPLTAQAQELAEKLRQAVIALHQAQTAAGMAATLAVAGAGPARRGRRRLQRRKVRATVAGSSPPSTPAGRDDAASRELALLDLEGARAAVAGLRAALELVPVRPTPLVRPAVPV